MIFYTEDSFLITYVKNQESMVSVFYLIFSKILVWNYCLKMDKLLKANNMRRHLISKDSHYENNLLRKSSLVEYKVRHQLYCREGYF